ncbi:MAG: DUF1761 domain-containing protein [Hyphomonadaceae bacterium]|jgi:hypothetical protein|nr:DUF1761 domain-containing protein [Hyphomonadaceae bacterium]
MSFGTLNYWPILIAATVSFAFGALWYTGLSRPWLAARDMSAADVERARAETGSTPLPYILAFVAQLVMAWIFAGVLLHLARGGVPVTIRTGLISGAFLWLGFVITTMAVNHAFQRVKPSLTLIDGGHWLGVLLIQGAILGWWGA